MIENAAVFIGPNRRFRNVNVEVTDGFVIIRNRANGSEMDRYSVVEVAKAGMAWDVTDHATGDSLSRMVVQQGCGCSGMKPYQNDEGYAGPFPGKK
jgi:hypothetical protein